MTPGLEDRPAQDLEFPRQQARTRSFTCGQPRTLTVSPDGERVVFLRSNAGDDPVNRLWVLDVATATERLVFDPVATPAEQVEMTSTERARRERARERSTGIVAYACDEHVTNAVFVDAGRLMMANLLDGGAMELPTPGVPDDPRLDPTGSRVGYVIDGNLHVQQVDGPGRVLASDDDPAVSWGLAEFAAAEEMDRSRGFWWSPDGSRLAACRVDERQVETWWITDPTDPTGQPIGTRYPRTGTANAIVTLHLFDVSTGAQLDVTWDEPERFEYLARVVWSASAPLTLLVESRDQRTTRVLEVDVTSGMTTLVREDVDEQWLELLDGSPARMDDGRLVMTVDADDRRRLTVGDAQPATPTSLHVGDIVDAGKDVWFSAWEDDPTQRHVFRLDGGRGEPVRVSHETGAHTAAIGGDTVAMTSWLEDQHHARRVVSRGGRQVAELANHAETPVVEPHPRFLRLGERRLPAALQLPGGRESEDPLPVLVSSYGGPGVFDLMRWRGIYREEQFFADRLGAAVLTIVGRGMQGIGVAWEKAINRDLSITLDDQVDGVQAAAKEFGFLDLDRVAIRGWSFGGLLSASAILRRPDVFHAGIVGAPVTDETLYDTHYTERYLGTPQDDPEAYRRSGVLPLVAAADPPRPLLLIHGLADDNVFVANTLQLSAALFARGYQHEVVLLPHASHIGGFDELVVGRYVAELDFLRRALGLEVPQA